MRITITIEASEAEAAALVEKLKEVFGDQVQVQTGPAAPVQPEEPAPIPAVPVEPAPPAPTPTGPPGRGQIFKNPDLTGDQIFYGANLAGPTEWWIEDHVGVSRPGGETQPIRSELKRPETSFEGYDRYLSAQYGNTAIEMGGSWRTFNWEFHQSNVAVRGGFTYDLAAVFHPIVKHKTAGGAEVFMNIDMAGDWFTNLEWRWLVRSLSGEVLAADDWRDGETLGATTFDLPFDRPHRYSWSWTCGKSEAVTFSIEFRNKWAVAMTRVWLHEATCVER